MKLKDKYQLPEYTRSNLLRDIIVALEKDKAAVTSQDIVQLLSREKRWNALAVLAGESGQAVSDLSKALAKAYRRERERQLTNDLFIGMHDKDAAKLLFYLTIAVPRIITSHAASELKSIAEDMARQLGFPSTNDRGFKALTLQTVVAKILDGTLVIKVA
jgi:hypothetical protein